MGNSLGRIDTYALHDHGRRVWVLCMSSVVEGSVVNKVSQKLAFFAFSVRNALVHASGDGNAKSPPQVHSTARWERRTALAAAVSPVAAEHCGWESEVHTDAIFYLCHCEIFLLCFLLLYGYLGYSEIPC